MLAKAAQTYGMVVRDHSGSVVFYGEDATPTGTDPWPGYFGGEPSAALARFPLEHLQLMQMSLSNAY
jgi:hypothetical protein